MLLTWAVVIRLLHTADWHLGAALQGWPRDYEQRAALAQLTAIAGAREVDAVIVAGDVFDSLNPSAEAQRLLYDALSALRAACPRATIVLIAGNHDPALRLEAPRPLFAIARVLAIGAVARRGGAIDLDAHLAPLTDAGGKVGAYLLAMPYPRAADLPIAGPQIEGSPVVWAVRELYREAIEAVRTKIGAAPLVVMGHLHIAGGIESEGAERRIIVGGEHAAPPDLFPPDVAYVALGHLHRPQSIGRIRYPGSLVPMSKTEANYSHGVSVVEIDETSGAIVEHVAFERAVAHLRLPASGALTFGEIEPALAALSLDPKTPIERRPFIYLDVKVDGPAVGLKAEIDALVEKFPVRLASLTIERLRVDATDSAPPQRLAERTPAELFAQAFVKTHGVAPSSEHLRRFDQLAQEE
jgi:exonuclease SbcD